MVKPKLQVRTWMMEAAVNKYSAKPLKCIKSYSYTAITSVQTLKELINLKLPIFVSFKVEWTGLCLSRLLALKR